MTFHVQTTVFEGPLDLLLQLITKHQVEISAIGLTEVVGEYLALLDEMQELDLEVTSERLPGVAAGEPSRRETVFQEAGVWSGWPEGGTGRLRSVIPAK